MRSCSAADVICREINQPMAIDIFEGQQRQQQASNRGGCSVPESGGRRDKESGRARLNRARNQFAVCFTRRTRKATKISGEAGSLSFSPNENPPPCISVWSHGRLQSCSSLQVDSEIALAYASWQQPRSVFPAVPGGKQEPARLDRTGLATSPADYECTTCKSVSGSQGW